MKPNSGTIPEEIAVIKSEPKKVQIGCPWDIVYTAYDDDEDDGTEMKEVVPAFVTDAASPKSIQTGKSWAARFAKNKNFTAVVETRKNKPIKDVVLCSLEHRGSGGRAYKVIADGIYVDCREDVIMDAMLKEGVKVGGILGGEYIWIKTGAHSRLIRLGSALHKKVELIVNRKEMKVIPAKELVPGKIYATKKDERALYLGRVNTTHFHYDQRNNGELEFLNIEYNNQLLFVRIPEYGERDVRKFIFVTSDKDSWRNIVSWTNLMNEKEHKYVEKVGEMDHEGIIEMLRDRGRNEIREALLAMHTGKNKQGWQYSKYALGYDISKNSKVANMYDVTGVAVPAFDYEPLLNFI